MINCFHILQKIKSSFYSFIISIYNKIFPNKNEKDEKLIVLDKNEIINNMFKMQFIDKLVSYDILDLCDYVCHKTNYNSIINWKLEFQFINKFYVAKKNIIYTSYELDLLNKLVRHLITINLFMKNNDLIEYIDFLRKKPELFDYRLWTNMILNPYFGEDEQKIFLTTYLANSGIIPIYKNVKYYNLEFSLYELIILGKMVPFNYCQDKNIVKMVRFFNKELIIKFINSFNRKCISIYFIIYFSNLSGKLDKDYLYTINNLIIKK
jgi:hypothetical protein